MKKIQLQDENDNTDQGPGFGRWSKQKTMNDAPGIVLYHGIEQAQGTMGGWTWAFKNGDWTYVVDDAKMCDDPKNCGLFLELLFKDQTRSIIKLKETK